MYPMHNQEAVFEIMRKIDDEIEVQYNQCRHLKGTSGTILVGAAYFDEFILADVKREIISGLHAGMTPQAAGKAAKAYARKVIKKHNSLRQDSNWQRWEGHADTYIDTTIRRILEADEG